MSQSLKLDRVTALQAYAQKFEPELLRLLYLGNETAAKVKGYAGIKGKLTLTEGVIGNLVKRWNKTFAATENAIEFKPRTLSTELVKIDLEIYPQEYESSYMAQMMRDGQNPEELPFQKFILDSVFGKKAEEQEYAMWNGDAAAVPASTDLLAAVIDGYKTIAKAEATAGNLTAVTTGALSDTNAVAAFEAVYESLDETFKKGTMDIWCSNAAKVHYIRDYRTRYGSGTITSDYMQFDLGKVNWNIVPGLGDFIMMTPRENLIYGYDGAADGNTFRFEASKRAIAIMMDFRIGCQIAIVDDKILAINNQ